MNENMKVKVGTRICLKAALKKLEIEDADPHVIHVIFKPVVDPASEWRTVYYANATADEMDILFNTGGARNLCKKYEELKIKKDKDGCKETLRDLKNLFDYCP